MPGLSFLHIPSWSPTRGKSTYSTGFYSVRDDAAWKAHIDTESIPKPKRNQANNNWWFRPSRADSNTTFSVNVQLWLTTTFPLDMQTLRFLFASRPLSIQAYHAVCFSPSRILWPLAKAIRKTQHVWPQGTYMKNFLPRYQSRENWYSRLWEAQKMR